ncbi:hypothetical protein DVH05_024828 [Phytophthora capsici]|nr:hypothetical protein DVH05_024828 [Phytophthora capsici]
MSESDSEREQDGGASVAVDSSDSDEREIQEIAPRFAKWHDTWDEFFACLREYEARTAQLYRIRSCMKVSARNEKIKKKKS